MWSLGGRPNFLATVRVYVARGSCVSVCLALFLPRCCMAEADSVPASAQLCSDAVGAPRCQGARKDLKAARDAFSRGVKLEHDKKLEEAFEAFQQAGSLVPQNIEYVTARELARQQLVGKHLER